MTVSNKRYFNSKDARNLITHYGFALFPVQGVVDNLCTCGHADCASPGKHPATADGFKSATKDIEQLKSLWNGRKNLNVGIATGSISGVFVIDVDGEQGEKDLEPYGPLPETLTVKTGRGRHLFFKHPGGTVKTRRGVIGEKVDVRGDGGYVAGPGSNHISGAVYEWVNPLDEPVDAPQWLIDIVLGDSQGKNKTGEKQAPEHHFSKPRLFVSNTWTEADAVELLSFISADCGYDEWIQIGMAIQSEGFGLHVWDTWSARSSKYPTAKDVAAHWRSFRPGAGISFGTLVKKAQDGGWMRTSAPQERTYNNNDLAEKPPQKEAISAPACAPQFTGLIADTIIDIIGTSQLPQPELATLNVLAALGAVFGRRYASPMNTRTNLYTVGIAYTASGKDHSRKYIKGLMYKAKLSPFLGPDSFVSGPGMLNSISKYPSQIMHIDEFGLMLAEMKNKNTSNHYKMCLRLFLEFYSTSNSTYYGGQYADGRPPVKIYNPNLSIYGVSTLENYISALDQSVISSGELNRYVIIKPEVYYPDRIKISGNTDPSPSIVDAWAALAPMFGANNPQDETPPQIVKWDWQEERIWQIQLWQDQKVREPITGSLWGRYAENVIKIAMIQAIARSHIRPHIETEDLDVAEYLVKKSCELMVTLANEQMYDSEHQKDCNELLSIIKKYGEKMPKRELANRSRAMDQKTRDGALMSLQERGAITIEKEQTLGYQLKYFITAL